MRRAALALACYAAPAAAQQAPTSVSVAGGATVTTDYRFRGLSRSAGDPALQATVTATLADGLYAGGWTSSVRDGSLPTPTQPGGDAELDLYVGYSRALPGGITLDGGVTRYLLPGAGPGLRAGFFEPYASASYTLGPITAKAGGNYAWGGQRGLLGSDSLYLYGEASLGLPGTPLTIRAHAGRTRGSLGRLDPGTSGYGDYSLTAEAVRRPFRVGATVSATDLRAADRPDGAHRGATLLGYAGVSF